MEKLNNAHPIQCEGHETNKPMTERVELPQTVQQRHKDEEDAQDIFKLVRMIRREDDGVPMTECHYYSEGRCREFIKIFAAAMKPPVSPSCALREALVKLEDLKDRYDHRDDLQKYQRDAVGKAIDIVEALAQATVEPTVEA